MFEERIHLLSPGTELSLIGKAEEIYRVHYALSKLIKRQEWIISGKIIVNIDNREDTITKIMKVFKNSVRRNTTFKDVPDNLVGISTSLLFYNLKYSDDSLIIRYLIGDKSQVTKFNEALVYNYKILINLLGLVGFNKFLENMVGLLNAETIEVPSYELAQELQKTLGASVQVKVFDADL